MKRAIIKVVSPVMLIAFLALTGCADQDHMSRNSMEKTSMSGEMNKEMAKDVMKSSTEMKKEMMSEASDTMEKEMEEGMDGMAKDMDESISDNMKKME